MRPVSPVVTNLGLLIEQSRNHLCERKPILGPRKNVSRQTTPAWY
jgi:hypothetical protein